MLLSEQIAQILQKLSQDWASQADQVLQERLGVGLSQLKIMDILQDNPGMSQRKIAQELNQTEAAVSRQIKLMQERSWLQTMVDPGERRRRLAKLTTSGLKITVAAQEILAEQYKTFCQNLTEKQQSFLLNLLNSLQH